jgi:hypothetical protein
MSTIALPRTKFRRKRRPPSIFEIIAMLYLLSLVYSVLDDFFEVYVGTFNSSGMIWMGIKGAIAVWLAPHSWRQVRTWWNSGD